MWYCTRKSVSNAACGPQGKIMRKQGKVVRWKDDKGFGFIEPSDGGKQAFVHIKTFHGGAGRPTAMKSATWNPATVRAA